MRLHVVLSLALFAIGVLGAWEWIRDAWRARSDRAIDRHPMALALRTLAEDERRRDERELALAKAIGERLRTRQVTSEAELFDIEAIWAAREAGEQGRCDRRG